MKKMEQFKECCVEYSDIVTREEMVRVLRSCAQSIRYDVGVRESLLDFINPIHDLTSFEYVVMHRTTNVVYKYSFEDIAHSLTTLARVLNDYTCDRLSETEWENVTAKLSTLQ